MLDKGINKIDINVRSEQLKSLVLDGLFTSIYDQEFELEELIQYCDELDYESMYDIISDKNYTE